MGPKLSVSVRGADFDGEGDSDWPKKTPRRLVELFLPDPIEPYHFGALGGLFRLTVAVCGRRRQGGGCRGRCGRFFVGSSVTVSRFELQAELDRRIEETLDGAER